MQRRRGTSVARPRSLPRSGSGGGKIRLLVSWVREIARSHGGHFIDFQKPFAALIKAYRATGARDNLLTVDGVHMNPLGNKVMANTILTGLDVPVDLRESVREAAEKR